MKPDRRPIHVFYGGAHLFSAGVAAKLGALALRSIEEHAPSPDDLASAFGLSDGRLARAVHAKVVGKLRSEPVEDYRIDFEDGFGSRSDEEEDREARRCGRELALGLASGGLPPFVGLRIKPLSRAMRRRSRRTLELFLSALASGAGRRVPPLVVTLPKVEGPEQPAALARLLTAFEKKHRLAPRAFGIELMIETPRSVLGADGKAAPPALVAAAGGRGRAVHFGPYDYLSSLRIAASEQTLDHPACRFARSLLQLSLAGAQTALSDGPTSLLPVGDRSAVHEGWRLHYANVRRSLAEGYYRSWDLHPAQLPARYAAVYAFFLEGLDEARRRLSNFRERSERATRLGGRFDDAATAEGLTNFLRLGLACGALTEEEAAEAT